MKLGIGLPNTMAHETDRTLMLEWARLADEAGFHVLGTIDKPNYDSWDPIDRAVRIADGFIFGTAGSQVMAQYAPGIREALAANGKPNATLAGLAYVGVGDDAQKALD